MRRAVLPHYASSGTPGTIGRGSVGVPPLSGAERNVEGRPMTGGRGGRRNTMNGRLSYQMRFSKVGRVCAKKLGDYDGFMARRGWLVVDRAGNTVSTVSNGRYSTNTM